MIDSVTRRFILSKILVLAALALCVISFWNTAKAQPTYPKKPINLVVPYPPGAGTDALGRLISAELQAALGQPVVVHNKAGASGNIGAQFVAQSAPDGYTLLLGVTSLIQQPAMLETLPFDILRDFTPIIQLAQTSNLFIVPLNSPANSLADFIALAKKHPDEYNYATWGAGSSAHIHGELLNMQAGTELVHVPYPGSAPLLSNLIGGHVASGFVDTAAGLPHVSTVRVLAVSGPNRLNAWLPEVPTFTELGYHSFEPRGWYGLFAPSATPEHVIESLNSEINRILQKPEIINRIQNMGWSPGGGSAQDFAAGMRNDLKTYADIVKNADIKLTP